MKRALEISPLQEQQSIQRTQLIELLSLSQKGEITELVFKIE